MLDAVGHPVRRLHRSVYAGLTLEGLEPGAWRRLEPPEVQRLSLPSSACLIDELLSRIDPALRLLLVQRCLPNAAPSRAALICDASASRCVVRSEIWFSIDVYVLSSARAAALDRARRRLQQAHAEGAEGRVELLVDLAEPPQRLAMCAQ